MDEKESGGGSGAAQTSQGGLAPTKVLGTESAEPGLKQSVVCSGHYTNRLPRELALDWWHGVQHGVTRWPPSLCGHSAMSMWRGGSGGLIAHGKAHCPSHPLQV